MFQLFFVIPVAAILVIAFFTTIPWDIAAGLTILLLWCLSYVDDSDRQASKKNDHP